MLLVLVTGEGDRWQVTWDLQYIFSSSLVFFCSSVWDLFRYWCCYPHIMIESVYSIKQLDSWIWKQIQNLNIFNIMYIYWNIFRFLLTILCLATFRSWFRKSGSSFIKLCHQDLLTSWQGLEGGENVGYYQYMLENRDKCKC